MSQQLLVWNSMAGKAGAVAHLRDRLACEQRSLLELSRDLDLQDAMCRAMRAGCETVIAAGGDGTVNAVVNAIMHLASGRRPRLAILPLGTANDFAATLCVPQGIDQALALLDTDQCMPIDVIKIQAESSQRFFANIAVGGNSVRVSQEMTRELKARWGALCYARGAIDVLADLTSFHIIAECDGERFENLDCWAVLVANGRTNAGRILVAPDASPVDGLADVIIIRDGDAWDMLNIISRAVLGSYLECDQVIHRQVKRLTLHSKPGMRFALDGEIFDGEPVSFEVITKAITTYVGRDFWMANPAGRIHA